MKTNAFEIVKGTTADNKAYTHTVYLKGQLLSDECYRFKDQFIYDEHTEFDTDEFFELKFSDIPNHFRLRFDERLFYKEFSLGWMVKHDDVMEVYAYCSSRDFKLSKWKYKLFFSIINNLAEQFHFNPFIYSESNGIHLEKSYKVKDSEDLMALYISLGKDFSELYEATKKALIKKKRPKK